MVVVAVAKVVVVVVVVVVVGGVGVGVAVAVAAAAYHFADTACVLGFQKSGGSRAVAAPPCRGGWGGGAPPFANVFAFSPRKSFEKKLWSISSSNNNSIIEKAKTKEK